MSKLGIKLGAALGAALAIVAVFATVALAAVTVSLGQPNGKRVAGGKIRLVVKVTGSSGGHVYVNIASKRKLQNGRLSAACSVTQSCDVISLHPWKHHPGKYTYSGPWFSFPGYWSTTPGKRFWQAQYFCPGSSCMSLSKIGSFRVK